ncbi:MAG: hypothetical protein A2663_00790 [Candidatus Buchananbacteria bacterium RIFCSPHIGHO2_01_FULL_46_12]|nr:MAG: hypothetical protein A2663_00790 [Candidatus Buchananbacteria bacterium RIFCSPHIGHO2_01_FULL_46_12]OGY52840.1 MAG: hypothetical protein A3B15_00935 [Candidatus Buchananbacteria bacterium RIFCSPLOWO2_01_FULL_45_31]
MKISDGIRGQIPGRPGAKGDFRARQVVVNAFGDVNAFQAGFLAGAGNFEAIIAGKRYYPVNITILKFRQNRLVNGIRPVIPFFSRVFTGRTDNNAGLVMNAEIILRL